MRNGVVVEYHREYAWILPDGGTEVMAKPRSRLELEQKRTEIDSGKEGRPTFVNALAVGDRVAVDEAEPDHFVIEEVFPRETWLMRRTTEHYGKRMRLVVANADQLAVVIAPNPYLKLNVVDRYFLAALQGGLNPILVINKIDTDPSLVNSVDARNYAELGFQVFFTSATDGSGLNELSAALNGQFTAFCGHSGVGKSTILREITGHEIEVGDVNEMTRKGRHTTTSSRMYHLSAGSVVDTPGVRTFGLAHLTWLDVHEYFSDIAQLANGCSYRDCNHKVEPNCQVLEAIESGQLSMRRLESYLKLRDECESTTAHWE